MIKSKKDNGYRLLVDMYVAEKNIRKFELRMAEFLDEGGFLRLDPTFDNQLLLALKSVAGTSLPEATGARNFHDDFAGARRFLSTAPIREDRREEAREKVTHYVHLWTVPHQEDLNLAKRMEYCSEDPLYMELDQNVLGEVQNLVRRVDWPDPFPEPDLRQTFVMATRQFEFADLGPYLFKLRGLPPFLDDWTQLAQLQNVTGRLNRVTEFWETKHGGNLPVAPDGASSADKRAWRDTLLTLNGLQASMTLESFRAAPYVKRNHSRVNVDE